MNQIFKTLKRSGYMLTVYSLAAAKIEGLIIILSVVFEIRYHKAIVYSLIVFLIVAFVGIVFQLLAKALKMLSKLVIVVITAVSRI